MNKQNLTMMVRPGTGTDERNASDGWTVYLECSIRADARCLSYALTVPEYVETWITLPGDHPGCVTIATRAEDDYLIEHQCKGKPYVRIAGTYFATERHRLMYSWRAEGIRRIDESYVDIRLRGDFEYTTVLLRHSGLHSHQNYLWHKALWCTSLERLKGLYEAPVNRYGILDMPGTNRRLSP